MVAILIVVTFPHNAIFLFVHGYSPQVVVGSVNDWQKERQFRALNDKKEERGVKVIRDGVERVVDIKVCYSLITHPHRFLISHCRK